MINGLCRKEYVGILDVAEIGNHREVVSRVIKLLCQLSAVSASPLSADDRDALNRCLANAGMAAREIAVARGGKVETSQDVAEVRDMLLASCVLIRLSGIHLTERSVYDYLRNIEDILDKLFGGC